MKGGVEKKFTPRGEGTRQLPNSLNEQPRSLTQIIASESCFYKNHTKNTLHRREKKRERGNNIRSKLTQKYWVLI